jgi:hypothetical protein
MADFHTQRARLLDARRRRDEADEQLRESRARLAQVRARLAALGRSGRATTDDEEGRGLLRAEETLRQETEARASLFARHELTAAGELGGLLALDRPQQLVSSLDDALPCLLLPVRLETKFMVNPNGARELWVRIFPDDIAVETHEEPLTQDEAAAGKAFWEETWRAGGDSAREEAAWRVLVSKFGAPRAPGGAAARRRGARAAARLPRARAERGRVVARAPHAGHARLLRRHGLHRRGEDARGRRPPHP